MSPCRAASGLLQSVLMDRSWINTRLFSKAHLDGVSEFMKFVFERFDENAEILCPCRKCLNQVCLDKGHVEDHLYIHGMASTYTRWINHGEPLEGIITENRSHSDEQLGFNDDVGLNQDVEDA
ncbi:hypothetical protein U9M48_001982 [Paspalum notatum var. saurae]|uniref:Transposase-associated domain-containing protein n=1 Tax=Paspalum notatum var. saurae TaxID=547442 RepID=A0AAQ3PH42_PASNO